ncbi:MAG: MFS transporter [Anaeromyxobacteraceae bacterium]
MGLLVGCSLIALGAGGIKPCVSAFVGDQFVPGEERLRDRVYGWFYWSINLGSFFSYLTIPTLLKTVGPWAAFGVPGILMLVSLLFFWGGTKHYRMTPPSGPNPHNVYAVIRDAVHKLGTGRHGQHWLDLALAKHPQEAVEGAKAVFKLAGVFAAVAFFWALFDQKSSTWVIQSKALDRQFFGVELSPAAFQLYNPVLVMVLIPFLTWVVFPGLERRGVSLAPLRKMTLGMFLTAISFGVAAVLQTFLDGGQTLSVMWQFPQYVFLTAGEVLVSVTGLEFAYSQAPRSLRSTIMSVWFLTAAAGNGITAILSKLLRLHGAANFWVYAALMLVAAIAFREVAKRYRPWSPEAAAAAAAAR